MPRYESRGETAQGDIEAVLLETDGTHFTLRRSLGGSWGSDQTTWKGQVTWEGQTLLLQAQQRTEFSYATVDEDPVERTDASDDVFRATQAGDELLLSGPGIQDSRLRRVQP
jgi:hypothetical protein